MAPAPPVAQLGPVPTSGVTGTRSPEPASATVTGGRAKAAYVTAGRRAQLPKQLQFAAASGAARSSKGKGPKRPTLYGSPSPSPTASRTASDAEETDYNNLDDDEEFGGLIGEVKELEEEEDDESDLIL